MSIQSKPKGGKRVGAGRKPNKVNLLRKSAALGLLSELEEKNQWRKFLKSHDERIRLQAFLAWNERAFGKPVQPVDVDGRLTLVIDL
jgi:hypothetical protein